MRASAHAEMRQKNSRFPRRRLAVCRLRMTLCIRPCRGVNFGPKEEPWKTKKTTESAEEIFSWSVGRCRRSCSRGSGEHCSRAPAQRRKRRRMKPRWRASMRACWAPCARRDSHRNLMDLSGFWQFGQLVTRKRRTKGAKLADEFALHRGFILCLSGAALQRSNSVAGTRRCRSSGSAPRSVRISSADSVVFFVFHGSSLGPKLHPNRGRYKGSSAAYKLPTAEAGIDCFFAAFPHALNPPVGRI